MYSPLRPWLFRLDAERAHALTLRTLQAAGALPPVASAIRRRYEAPAQPVELFGLTFPNRIGLAAGYDKDGLAWRGLAALGFGHIEIGTVTPRPQSGNPKPRIFRLIEDQALINRLGFPSRGAAFVARRLRGLRPEDLVIGVNMGINKDTPLEKAADDYVALVEIFNPLADYLVINVSSPNTPDLRRLETGQRLVQLLAALAPYRQKPLLVKISPDLPTQELHATLDALVVAKVDGLIATNTTIRRPTLFSRHAVELGGLSGPPLAGRNRDLISQIHKYTQGQVPIIAAGGIMSAAEARAALEAGASLVQVYTGLVYRGPSLVPELVNATN